VYPDGFLVSYPKEGGLSPPHIVEKVFFLKADVENERVCWETLGNKRVLSPGSALMWFCPNSPSDLKGLLL